MRKSVAKVRPVVALEAVMRPIVAVEDAIDAIASTGIITQIFSPHTLLLLPLKFKWRKISNFSGINFS